MDNDHVYTVIDLPTLEVMQNLMKEPEMIKLREQPEVNYFNTKQSKVRIIIINIRFK